MFDFGDDLTVESFRIPWLIWIQVLVMLLLILLIYCFLALDPTDNVEAIASSSSSSSTSSQLVSNDNTHINKQFPNQNTATTVITNRLRNTQVRNSFFFSFFFFFFAYLYTFFFSTPDFLFLSVWLVGEFREER